MFLCMANVCICMGHEWQVYALGQKRSYICPIRFLQQKAGSPRTFSMLAPSTHEHGTDTSSLQMLSAQYKPQD